MLRARCIVVLAGTLILVVVPGCGEEGALDKPTAHLTGAVTINGQPVPSNVDEASVDFFPAAGGGQAQPTSARIVNGKYDAPSVPIGKVTVFFHVQRFTGRMISEDGGSPFRQMEDLAPAEAQQGIDIEVTGDATKDFHL